VEEDSDLSDCITSEKFKEILMSDLEKRFEAKKDKAK